MSVVVMWRCVDCAAIDEIVATEVSAVLASYVPAGWTLSKSVEDDYHRVHCPQCSQTDEPSDQPINISEKKG